MPDYRACARLVGLPAETPGLDHGADWATAQKPFKAELQQVVSLGAAWVGDDGTLERLTTLGPGEPTAVRQFLQTISDHHPVLAEWNIGGFDLSVLLVKSLNPVAVRPSGGVYFVPAKHTETRPVSSNSSMASEPKCGRCR